MNFNNIIEQLSVVSNHVLLSEPACLHSYALNPCCGTILVTDLVLILDLCSRKIFAISITTAMPFVSLIPTLLFFS